MKVYGTIKVLHLSNQQEVCGGFSWEVALQYVVNWNALSEGNTVNRVWHLQWGTQTVTLAPAGDNEVSVDITASQNF
jgi:hypothetical protein